MQTIINLYSDKNGEIYKFLSKFYNKDINLDNDLKWEKSFSNPIEISDIISTLIDNKEDYKINAWISLDEGVFINVTSQNLDDIIRYLYERYPY